MLILLIMWIIVALTIAVIAFLRGVQRSFVRDGGDIRCGRTITAINEWIICLYAALLVIGLSSLVSDADLIERSDPLPMALVALVVLHLISDGIGQLMGENSVTAYRRHREERKLTWHYH